MIGVIVSNNLCTERNDSIIRTEHLAYELKCALKYNVHYPHSKKNSNMQFISAYSIKIFHMILGLTKMFDFHCSDSTAEMPSTAWTGRVEASTRLCLE